MSRRGFFAELQYQSRRAAQDRQRAEREAIRNHVATSRLWEQARKAEERAQLELAKATESERKKLGKDIRAAHMATREAEVAEKNGRLLETYDDLGSLLASTLSVDDYVDLRSLRVVVAHPPFGRTDLEMPLASPKRSPDPKEPVLRMPGEPTGLASIFGKKKYEQALDDAQHEHEDASREWRDACRKLRVQFTEAEAAHAKAEAVRAADLKSERVRYAKECSARESEAAQHNKKLVELIANLGYGTPEAIQEYITIVLSNSVYPEHFPVTHEFEFDASVAELSLRVLVPPPSDMPTVKAYKYNKTAEEITSTPLPQKECKARYESAIHQVALRSFHEIFESDRRGLIKTISLEVGTKTVDPATGQRTFLRFVSVAAERETFLQFDLSAVVPGLTLQRLGAAVSKNPYALVAAERSGVRRS